LRSIENRLKENPIKINMSINKTRSGTLENLNKGKKDIDLKDIKNKVYESMDLEKSKKN